MTQNPIEKALATADVVQGANRALEHQSSPGVRVLTRAELAADARSNWGGGEGDEQERYAADVLGLFDRASRRGDGVAVYENHDLGHHEVGERQYVTFGSDAAQLETAGSWTGKTLGLAQFGLAGYIPYTLPDIGAHINYRFQLVAIALPDDELLV